jgi:DNA primase
MNLEEIKNKLDIVDVVQRYVKLKRVGKYYSGLCPFHRETKPSFYVSPEMQIFKCFGCNEAGDVFKFLMKIENLNFSQVLTKLKDEYGLEISEFKSNQEANQEKKKIFEINYSALKFFRQELKKRIDALDYLFSRGLNQETIDYFEIGFSPGGTLLRDYLYSLGYSFDLIKKAGLIDSQNFDRFQSRIIFPLRDENNKLIGFSGRIFPLNANGPKYLNTPETIVFQKGKFLYGLNYSKEYILSFKKVILVEGQFDFLLSWQNGLRNLVAVSGSALTEDHLLKLKKYSQILVFSFDNDEAGFNAELRANLMAKKLNFQTYKLIYEGKDLGEYFLLNERKPLEEKKYEDYLLEILFKEEQKEKKLTNVSIYLNQIKLLPPLERDEYLTKLSSVTQLTKDFLIEELKKESPVSTFHNKQIEIFEEKTLEEKLSLRLLSLIYTLIKENLVKNFEFFQEVANYLSLELKELYWKIITNQLTDEENEYFEMRKSFYLESKLDLKKDYYKTLKQLKIIYLKNILKKLNDSLKFASFQDNDKIIKEINETVNQLKIIMKNG